MVDVTSQKQQTAWEGEGSAGLTDPAKCGTRLSLGRFCCCTLDQLLRTHLSQYAHIVGSSSSFIYMPFTGEKM